MLPKAPTNIGRIEGKYALAIDKTSLSNPTIAFETQFLAANHLHIQQLKERLTQAGGKLGKAGLSLWQSIEAVVQIHTLV